MERVLQPFNFCCVCWEVCQRLLRVRVEGQGTRQLRNCDRLWQPILWSNSSLKTLSFLKSADGSKFYWQSLVFHPNQLLGKRCAQTTSEAFPSTHQITGNEPREALIAMASAACWTCSWVSSWCFWTPSAWKPPRGWKVGCFNCGMCQLLAVKTASDTWNQENLWTRPTFSSASQQNQQELSSSLTTIQPHQQLWLDDGLYHHCLLTFLKLFGSTKNRCHRSQRWA